MRRFSDAQDLKTLARMLDEMGRSNQGYGYTPLGIAGRALDGMHEGALVHVLPGGTLRKADAALDRLASGVVLKMESDVRAVWTPMALVELKLKGTATGTNAEIWLDEGGLATMTKPTTGLVQKIGERITRNAANSKFLCLVHPAAGADVLAY